MELTPQQGDAEFNEFVKRQGLRIWQLTKDLRKQHNHGTISCNTRVPMLLGGSDSCHECETYFENILLELWQRGRNGDDPSSGSSSVVDHALAA